MHESSCGLTRLNSSKQIYIGLIFLCLIGSSSARDPSNHNETDVGFENLGKYSYSVNVVIEKIFATVYNCTNVNQETLQDFIQKQTKQFFKKAKPFVRKSIKNAAYIDDLDLPSLEFLLLKFNSLNLLNKNINESELFFNLNNIKKIRNEYAHNTNQFLNISDDFLNSFIEYLRQIMILIIEHATANIDARNSAISYLNEQLNIPLNEPSELHFINHGRYSYVVTIITQTILQLFLETHIGDNQSLPNFINNDANLSTDNSQTIIRILQDNPTVQDLDMTALLYIINNMDGISTNPNGQETLQNMIDYMRDIRNDLLHATRDYMNMSDEEFQLTLLKIISEYNKFIKQLFIDADNFNYVSKRVENMYKLVEKDIDLEENEEEEESSEEESGCNSEDKKNHPPDDDPPPPGASTSESNANSQQQEKSTEHNPEQTKSDQTNAQNSNNNNNEASNNKQNIFYGIVIGTAVLFDEERSGLVWVEGVMTTFYHLSPIIEFVFQSLGVAIVDFISNIANSILAVVGYILGLINLLFSNGMIPFAYAAFVFNPDMKFALMSTLSLYSLLTLLSYFWLIHYISDLILAIIGNILPFFCYPITSVILLLIRLIVAYRYLAYVVMFPFAIFKDIENSNSKREKTFYCHSLILLEVLSLVIAVLDFIQYLDMIILIGEMVIIGQVFDKDYEIINYCKSLLSQLASANKHDHLLDEIWNDLLMPLTKDTSTTITNSTPEHNYKTKEEIQIFVKGVDGRTYTINISPTETVSVFKNMIFDKMGLEPEYQVLDYAGKPLKNHIELHEYNIRNESTIHMKMRMLGGFFKNCFDCN